MQFPGGKLSANTLINKKNDEGETPIHLAAQMGKTLLVETLLKSGADIYIANNRGLTARDDDKTG